MEASAKCALVGPADCRERLQSPVRFSFASYFRYSSAELLGEEVQIQDRDQTDRDSNQVRGLVCHDRSKGCILPGIHPSSTQEVPEVCFWGQSVPVSGFSFQARTFTLHFHQVCGFCFGSLATPQHPHIKLLYMDDWLILAQSEHMKAQHRDVILAHMKAVRFHSHSLKESEDRPVTVKWFQRLLGLMAAASNVIPFGLL